MTTWMPFVWGFVAGLVSDRVFDGWDKLIGLGLAVVGYIIGDVVAKRREKERARHG